MVKLSDDEELKPKPQPGIILLVSEMKQAYNLEATVHFFANANSRFCLDPWTNQPTITSEWGLRSIRRYTVHLIRYTEVHRWRVRANSNGGWQAQACWWGKSAPYQETCSCVAYLSSL